MRARSRFSQLRKRAPALSRGGRISGAESPYPMSCDQRPSSWLVRMVLTSLRPNHLDDGKLKRLMARNVTSWKSAPAFLELLTPRATSLPECTIELEGKCGKIRIQLKGASASNLAGLSRGVMGGTAHCNHGSG